MIDRVLAMIYQLTRDILSDPPAFALFIAGFLACLITIGIGWHYLCRACAAATRHRHAEPGQPPAPARRSADPHARAQLDACEASWQATPSLRARIVRRARERAANRRARTRI